MLTWATSHICCPSSVWMRVSQLLGLSKLQQPRTMPASLCSPCLSLHACSTVTHHILLSSAIRPLPLQMGLRAVRNNIKVQFWFTCSWCLFVLCMKKDLLSASALKQKLACNQTEIACSLLHEDLNNKRKLWVLKLWYVLTHLMYCTLCFPRNTVSVWSDTCITDRKQSWRGYKLTEAHLPSTCNGGHSFVYLSGTKTCTCFQWWKYRLPFILQYLNRLHVGLFYIRGRIPDNWGWEVNDLHII